MVSKHASTSLTARVQSSMVHFPPIRLGIKRVVAGKLCVCSRKIKCLSQYGRASAPSSNLGTRPSARSYNSPVDPLEFSRYARQLVATKLELREELEQAKDAGWTREAMQSFLREQGAGDEGALHSALRRLRQRVLLRTMARDLSGTADLDEVCGTMSALAEIAIEASLEFLEPRIEAISEVPRPRLVVVGMG